MTDIKIQIARAARGGSPARPAINAPKNATFQIRETKLYLPNVTLSTEYGKRTIKNRV